MKVLITGVAGFIGMHVGLRLLARGHDAAGIDNLNPYYDPALKRAPLDLYNEGKMVRDFTYIDDVVEALVRLLDKPATPSARFDRAHPDPAESDAPYRVFNVGGGQPMQLLEVIGLLEAALGKKALRRPLPMQPGDVLATHARCTRLQDWVGPCPVTPLDAGIRRFVDWYLTYPQAAGRP
jgi:UDP-glucuronate 4-epimerase